MSLLSRLLGEERSNERLKSLVGRMIGIAILSAIATQLTTTFFMISIAETLGGGSFIEGMAIVGMLMALEMGVQTILDYPSSVIGDWIGQRYIICCAHLCYAAAMLTISMTDSLTPLSVFAFVFVLNGIGNSQMSGSVSSWFDNNYRVVAPHDTEKKRYGVILGNLNALFQVAGTMALIPGGLLAGLIGRTWVFRLEAVLLLIVGLLSLRVIQDLPEVRNARIRSKTMSGYGQLLREGLAHVARDRFLALMIVGQSVLFGTSAVWGMIYLFPMYYTYLDSDLAVSTYRTLLFWLSVVQIQRAAVWSAKLDISRWLPRSAMLMSTGSVFFVCIAAVMYFFVPVGGDPVTLYLPFTAVAVMQIPAGSIVPLILIFAVFLVCGIFGSLFGILSQRILLDAIPDRIRNSVYSLTPALSTLVAVPQVAIFGWTAQFLGFPTSMVLTGVVSLVGAVTVAEALRVRRQTLEAAG